MRPSPATTLPAHTLRALLERYGAGEPLHCRPVSEGLLNRGYQLTTTRGRFFLKHHLDGDPEAIDRQHRATARLGAVGLPVVPPVPAPDGRTVTVLGDRCYALHPWVDGRHRHGCELSSAQSHRLGELLGEVHTRLEQVIPRTDGPAHPSADPEDTRALIEELLARVRSRPDFDSFDALAEHRLLERRELLRRYEDHRPPPGAEPVTGWVHGDFHPLNLLYRDSPAAAEGGTAPRGPDDAERRGPAGGATRSAGAGAAATRPHAGGSGAGPALPLPGAPADAVEEAWETGAEAAAEPIAIVDWDRLGVQPRAEETVRGAAIFFLRPDGTLDLARIQAYARAYRSAAGASPDELSAAVHRVWWERLNDFWMLCWRYQSGDHRPDAQFPAAAALVVWWTAQYEAVRRAFCC